MDFDIKSMKQRAKTLLKETKPHPLGVGVIFTVFIAAYMIISFATMASDCFWIAFIVMELLYLNIRSSCNWYALKVTREEATQISDVVIAYKERPIGMFFLGVIKNICYIIGFCMCYVGFFIPFYGFRFSVYIMRDDKVNPFVALGRSMKLLKGSYLQLLKLDISNLGWYALMVVTLGIAGFYVKPYTSIVYAEFYDYLKTKKAMLA